MEQKEIEKLKYEVIKGAIWRIVKQYHNEPVPALDKCTDDIMKFIQPLLTEAYNEGRRNGVEECKKVMSHEMQKQIDELLKQK